MKLEGNLHLSRRVCTDNFSEIVAAGVSFNCCRAEELCMVKDVERFDAKLQRFRLCQGEDLSQRHVEIVEPRTVEPTRHISKIAERRDAKQSGIERLVANCAGWC
jgi:hypothetical protein